ADSAGVDHDVEAIELGVASQTFDQRRHWLEGVDACAALRSKERPDADVRADVEHDIAWSCQFEGTLEGRVGSVPAHERPDDHPIVERPLDVRAAANLEANQLPAEEQSRQAQLPATPTNVRPPAEGGAKRSNDCCLVHRSGHTT